ncbi:hypothetical protein [Deinococcus yavapaiensis]|uniref:Uncharacterized protein n=1 Tax=Deinococcus yavapaiensis KR-236 TaxID=694435 RepID=A0A318SHA3_9DEIO|nr:hypothetical protein [Deinococcus yavapaiensis]PYE56505.1 hypothetical protein DES52_101309 [Deinococcus yavapaiensis KR-236]
MYGGADETVRTPTAKKRSALATSNTGLNLSALALGRQLGPLIGVDLCPSVGVGIFGHALLPLVRSAALGPTVSPFGPDDRVRGASRFHLWRAIHQDETLRDNSVVNSAKWYVSALGGLRQ